MCVRLSICLGFVSDESTFAMAKRANTEQKSACTGKVSAKWKKTKSVIWYKMLEKEAEKNVNHLCCCLVPERANVCSFHWNVLFFRGSELFSLFYMHWDHLSQQKLPHTQSLAHVFAHYLWLQTFKGLLSVEFLSLRQSRRRRHLPNKSH